MITISVIIPTHDRGVLVSRAIASVRAQTKPPDEIIVVDDGSRDDTENTVQSRFPNVRYLRQDHQGVSAARNLGISQAQGEWLAFLDSDDAWLPDKLALQRATIDACPEARIVHGDEIWIRDGRRVNPMRKHRKYGGWIYPRCLPLCVISPSCVMIHREVFADVGLFDTTLPACEDYDLWLRICCRYPVEYIDRPLITKYGGHDDQLSRRYPAMDRFRIEALLNILNSGHLSSEDRPATEDMLRQKTRIYIEGVRRRGRHEEADTLAARIGACMPATATEPESAHEDTPCSTS